MMAAPAMLAAAPQQLVSATRAAPAFAMNTVAGAFFGAHGNDEDEFNAEKDEDRDDEPVWRGQDEDPFALPGLHVDPTDAEAADSHAAPEQVAIDATSEPAETPVPAPPGPALEAEPEPPAPAQVVDDAPRFNGPPPLAFTKGFAGGIRADIQRNAPFRAGVSTAST